MTAKEHNNLLGIFILIQGGLTMLVGLILVLVYAGIGVALMGGGRDNEARMVGGIMFGAGIVIGILIVLFSIFYLYTGVKVRKMQNIGRTLGIVVSILSLFSFPLGTALGVYGLWFLLGDLGKGLYHGGHAPAGFTSSAPPPNSWQ
jgi:hypothetical protein